MSNFHTISNLPDVPLRQILEYLPMSAWLNLRLVSSELKDAVDNLRGLTVTFEESDDQDKIDGAKNLRINTLKVISITPEHFPLLHPDAVRNLYIYNDIDSVMFQQLFNHLENVRKIKIYADSLEGNPQNFQNHLKAFESVKDLRLFHFYQNDSTATFASINRILDFQLINLKSLSIDYYACQRKQTKLIAEKVISRILAQPNITTIKLRLQECIYEEEEKALSSLQDMIDFMAQPNERILNITKCHLFIDVSDILTWTPILYSIRKAKSLNLRFFIRSYQPQINAVINDLFDKVLANNANTLTEVRLGELATGSINNGNISRFNTSALCNIKNLKILKLSRSFEDMLSNYRETDRPFLSNLKQIPKTVQEIIILNCTYDQTDIYEMLDGMTRLRNITISAGNVCDNIRISYAHIHKIMTQSNEIKYIEVGPVFTPQDRLLFITELTRQGVVESQEYNGKITIKFSKEGYQPKEYDD